MSQFPKFPRRGTAMSRSERARMSTNGQFLSELLKYTIVLALDILLFCRGLGCMNCLCSSIKTRKISAWLASEGERLGTTQYISAYAHLSRSSLFLHTQLSKSRFRSSPAPAPSKHNSPRSSSPAFRRNL
jgi:hypothetical protein